MSEFALCRNAKAFFILKNTSSGLIEPATLLASLDIFVNEIDISSIGSANLASFLNCLNSSEVKNKSSFSIDPAVSIIAWNESEIDLIELRIPWILGKTY
mgnify:CR=1 FL=1